MFVLGALFARNLDETVTKPYVYLSYMIRDCSPSLFTHVLPLSCVSFDFDFDFDYKCSVFNVFKSAIAYDTSIKTLPNIAKEGGEEHMVEYEFEPDTKEEVMQV